MTGAGTPLAGWVADDVAAEFPGLRLLAVDVTLDTAPGSSPRDVRDRLRALSSRVRGSQAIVQRQQPIPHAYRVFFRQVGLDPDTTRTPAEEAVLARLLHGEFRSRSLLDDALTIALVETGVPVRALDVGTLDGGLGIRAAAPGERLGRRDPAAPAVAAGRLVLADASGPLAELFGPLAGGHGVTRSTRRIRLYAIAVPGVPAIHAEEALWCAAELLDPRPAHQP
jgi:DNA/RNA-binding domain of Phe-tRNA-synthetase-like protein